ncbi:MAG: PIN domain-containing protein [Betaproteobacteria bacterium]|nr:PIN domain-containing protein [Betaproteobacteria bacterium]
MPSILVDTGPLVALASRRDHWHARCVRFLQNYRGELITTWPVLTEFSHLVDTPASLQQLQAWAQRGSLRIHAMGHDELKHVVDWMARYADRPMDLADASLVHVACVTGVQEVWSIDRADFETYRLPNRRRFRLVAMN